MTSDIIGHMMGVGQVVGAAMTNDIVTDRCNNNIRRKCPDMVSRNNNDNSENNYYNDAR